MEQKVRAESYNTSNIYNIVQYRLGCGLYVLTSALLLYSVCNRQSDIITDPRCWEHFVSPYSIKRGTEEDQR